MLNNVTLIGRLIKDIDLRYTTSNRAYAGFCIAVNRAYSKDGKREADFINIVAWDKLAENLKKYTSKGSLIAVEGRIQTGSYEVKDGTKRTITEVIASNIQFLDKKETKQEEIINNGLPEDNLEMPF